MTPDERITTNGLRLTTPRKKILSIFSSQAHPISFEEYALLDTTIDKSTFYRNMQTFEAAEIIQGIESDEGKRYFELSEKQHPHFICQYCHTITCLDEAPIPNLSGYRINSITYKGQCPLCSDI
ncbi:MAG: transcriptional repressor [Sulfuricurvum sp.]|jgi:Fur family ferric uptake transcriptional regulator|nr:transcriptional repressor [Sulfuricurvum sp.]MDP3022472.1 transcriptional repressor [Sulfuricurvum sp.]MDP3119576.1 transcriptional repressor [Sulfuricurvum sp.]